jgi:hypothetical protein
MPGDQRTTTCWDELGANQKAICGNCTHGISVPQQVTYIKTANIASEACTVRCLIFHDVIRYVLSENDCIAFEIVCFKS